MKADRDKLRSCANMTALALRLGGTRILIVSCLLVELDLFIVGQMWDKMGTWYLYPSNQNGRVKAIGKSPKLVTISIMFANHPKSYLTQIPTFKNLYKPTYTI